MEPPPQEPLEPPPQETLPVLVPVTEVDGLIVALPFGDTFCTLLSAFVTAIVEDVLFFTVTVAAVFVIFTVLFSAFACKVIVASADASTATGRSAVNSEPAA